MPILVQLYPNIPINVTLKYPNTVINPLPAGTINLGTLYASNSIVIGNTLVNSVINSTAINIQSIFANGSIGAAGEVLHSNGAGMYWSALEQKLFAGNGLTSNTSHYEVLANTGIVANSTGTFVNSAYISTITVDNSTNLNGQPASYYTNATNLSAGTVDFNRLPANIVFWSNTNTYTAVQTYNANINVVANSTAQLNFGNNTVNAAITSNDTHVYFTGTAYKANNADYLDGYDISNILSEISTAYTNATTFSSNATNIASGTVNEVLLPFRMNQDVRTTDNVIFNNATISGNLTVIGSSIVVQGNTTTFVDNMLYLNQGVFANITNITSDGTYVTFYANTNYQAGWDVYVSGVNPSSYNGFYTNIFAANSTAFRVANTNIDSYVSGGTARGKTDSNPDLGIAAGYNDGTYHHTGIFRDASDGIWKVFEGYDPEPDASIYIDTSDPSFQIANFQANFLYLGNTSTNWVTANQTGIYAGTTLIGNSIGAYGKTEGSLNVNSSLTANNSTYLNGELASYYTNATNLTTGTLNYSRLPANAVFWSNTNSYTAVQTYNANLFVNAATLSVGNTTSNVTVNTTTIKIGNASVNVTINSTAFSGTSDNITGILDYSSLPANVVIWSNTNTFTDIQIFEANLFVNSATLSVGNTTSNITANTTVLCIGNSSVNTTINSTSISVESLLANGSLGNSGDVLYSNGTGIYWDVPTGGGGGLLAGNGLTSNTTHYEVLANSGIVSNSTGTFVNTAYIATLTANDSTNLGGQPASYYTNATNISTGTLNYARLPANVVIWSNTNTYTAVQTYNANLFVNAVTLSVGNTTSNVTVNTTVITVGNTTVNTQINSTALVLKSLIANGSIGGVGELLASNGTGLYWTTPPSGSFSNGTAYTWSATQTFQANVVLEDRLSANGSFGSAGQVLTSAGTGSNVYWATPASGGLSDSYETVNKNLKAYDATYSYSGGILQTITYSIPPSSTIVKTFNYTGEVLTSIVLSGSTPGGIELTKTFGYTSGSLTSVTYT